MRKVKIITDSCSDLNKDLLEKYDIDYAKMNTVYEGVTTPADLTWTPEDVHKLYGIMRDGNRVLTTQVPVEEFNRIFKKYIDLGFDIVYIGCSLKQSGSVNTGAVVAKQLMEENPGVQIFSIDSLNACIAEGMLAIEASKFAAQGKTAQEVHDYVIKIRKTIHEYCTVHSLDALRRAGRVKGAAAFFGNLMGVKPIIISDAVGNQAAFKKVKGRQNSLKEIVNLLKADLVKPEEQTIYIAHADCSEEEVNQFVELVKQEIPCKEIFVGYIGPIIGASIGPDAIVINGFGEEVTYSLGA
ncbi:MAG: DegV family protein [Treponema sp.]|nr:DegV family protein [Treponema sp.]